MNSRPDPRAGMTLFEVVVCTLVITMGLASLIGLSLYGVRMLSRASAQATGLATAMSVLHDPSPADAAGNALLSPSGAGSVDGYVNGYYVQREEKPVGGASGPYTWKQVTVRVYLGDLVTGGGFVAEASDLLLRKTAP